MITTVGVVIPAANEQRRIGACLAAVADARRHAARTVTRAIRVRVLVVLDSCVDQTGAVVAEHGGVEAVAGQVGSVGLARGLGARYLLRTGGISPAQLWLANTDADSRVPLDWISRMVAEADGGTHLLLGTVLPDIDMGSQTGLSWRRRHLLRDNHPHVHGANLGIRADVYQSLGGWSALRSGEDVALAERAAAAGHLRITRTATIPVLTSARDRGRAPEGFAGYLRRLDPAAQLSATG